MKNIYLIVLAIMFASLSGCEDLDQGSDGVNSADGYFADELSLDAGITGIYGTLTRAGWGVDILAAYTGADDLSTHSAGNKDIFREGDLFSVTGSNARLGKLWKGYYMTINNCNVFLANAKPIGMEEEILNNFYANARFVRGMLYFRLATIFGDIPMPLSGEPDYSISKTPKRKVMAQVIEDLEYAAKWAVSPRDEDPMAIDGHASKTAAKALLAKVYMQLTGYPYNETEQWAKVKSNTESIINSGLWSLTDVYSHNFQDPTQLNNNEIIWAHQFKREAWPIGTESRWYGAFWTGWMDMFLEWNYYNNFPDGFRKNYCTSTTSAEAVKYDHPVLTKLIYGSVKGKPEYVHTFRTNNDMPAMRYAEVLLMYAEACANSSETANAIEALNKVVRRAYAGNSTTEAEVVALGAGFWKNADATIDYVAGDFATTEDLVDAICTERLYEFTAEVGGNRWLDLVRLEKVGEANASRDARELALKGNPADNTLWFAPIPENEIKLNPNLLNIEE